MSGADLNILLINSDREFEHRVAAGLRLFDCTVTSVSDVPEALLYAYLHRPDAVFANVDDPAVVGVELCSEIRAVTGGAAGVLLIAVCEEIDNDRKNEAKRAGFDCQMATSLDTARLIRRLQAELTSKNSWSREECARYRALSIH